MSTILVQNKVKKKKYKVYYGKKILKQNTVFHLQDNMYIIIKEKSIYNNIYFMVFCWVIVVLKLLIDLISIIMPYGVGGSGDSKELKFYQKIRINYNRVLENEVLIILTDLSIEINGLEVESVVYKGGKLERLDLKEKGENNSLWRIF